jgi:hypothetical protein
VFCNIAPDQQVIVASTSGSAQASVVATLFAAHFHDGPPAARTRHATGQQFRRIHRHSAGELSLKAASGCPTRPRLTNRGQTALRLIPEFTGHDPKRLIFRDDPVFLGLRELASSASPTVSPGLGSVPDPTAGVF